MDSFQVELSIDKILFPDDNVIITTNDQTYNGVVVESRNSIVIQGLNLYFESIIEGTWLFNTITIGTSYFPNGFINTFEGLCEFDGDTFVDGTLNNCDIIFDLTGSTLRGSGSSKSLSVSSSTFYPSGCFNILDNLELSTNSIFWIDLNSTTICEGYTNVEVGSQVIIDSTSILDQPLSFPLISSTDIYRIINYGTNIIFVQPNIDICSAE